MYGPPMGIFSLKSQQDQWFYCMGNCFRLCLEVGKLLKASLNETAMGPALDYYAS